MKWTTLLVALMPLALAGCQTFASVTDDARAAIRGEVKRANCAPWRPISTSRRDTLTEQTAAEISAHNNVWDALCGSP